MTRDLPGDPGLLPTPHEGARGPFVGTPARRPIRRFAHDERLNTLFLDLQRAFGPQEWWPARTPFEVIVGAILTQNTAWGNVERALAGLSARSRLTPAALLALPAGELAAAIRPSGYFRTKARKLHAVSRWYLAIGGLAALRERPLAPLRRSLLGVWGVGPETADSILCYAAGRRTPVVDAYTRRVLTRHGFLPPAAGYEEVRGWLAARLVLSPAVYEEFHALLVRAGTHHCKPTPRCESCPVTENPLHAPARCSRTAR
ncbi:MAG: endonuclease [Planctomycetota bacterium]